MTSLWHNCDTVVTQLWHGTWSWSGGSDWSSLFAVLKKRRINVWMRLNFRRRSLRPIRRPPDEKCNGYMYTKPRIKNIHIQMKQISNKIYIHRIPVKRATEKPQSRAKKQKNVHSDLLSDSPRRFCACHPPLRMSCRLAQKVNIQSLRRYRCGVGAL